MQKLNEAQIEAQLRSLPEWSGSGGGIQRTYGFRNFVEAMKFVNSVAAAAEAANHHPDLLIRYNKVTLTLSTHDAGGVTQKDFDLAARCDAMGPPPPPPAPAVPAPAAPARTGGATVAAGSKRAKKGA